MLQALKEDDAAILKELDVVRQHCCTASISKLSYFWSLVLHFDIDHRFVAMVQCC